MCLCSRQLLGRLMSNSSIAALVFVEQELPSLRASAGPAVKMFYPASPRDTKRNEYVDVDAFPTRLGRSFGEFVRESKVCNQGSLSSAANS